MTFLTISQGSSGLATSGVMIDDFVYSLTFFRIHCVCEINYSFSDVISLLFSNILDIAPRYAGLQLHFILLRCSLLQGIIMGIANTFATIPGQHDKLGLSAHFDRLRRTDCRRTNGALVRICHHIFIHSCPQSGYCSDLNSYWEGPNLCPPHVNTTITNTQGFTECSVGIAKDQWRFDIVMYFKVLTNLLEEMFSILLLGYSCSAQCNSCFLPHPQFRSALVVSPPLTYDS